MLLLGWVLAVSPALPVSAAGGLCDDEAGQPIPNCTVVEPDFSTSTDTGLPSGFVAVMVLVGIAGVGVTIYRVWMARDLARRSGMDPDRATAMTLLEDDGLEATYLAANLRPQTPPSPARPAERRVGDRLAELDALLAEGRVTQAEYDERRTAILGSL